MPTYKDLELFQSGIGGLLQALAQMAQQRQLNDIMQGSYRNEPVISNQFVPPFETTMVGNPNPNGINTMNRPLLRPNTPIIDKFSKGSQPTEEFGRLTGEMAIPANPYQQVQTGTRQVQDPQLLLKSLLSIASSNPMAMKQLQLMQFEKDFNKPERVNVGRGSDVIDPTTGRIIYSNPEEKTSRSPTEIELALSITKGDPQKALELIRSPNSTELFKYYGELESIKRENPQDKRIPIWEQKIKNISQGLPFFSFPVTAEGIVPMNARTGKSGTATGLGKPLTGEMITQESQLATIRSSLDQVKNLYNPSYVGFVEGRWGSVKENTIGVDNEQALFYSSLEDIKNSLIYLKSGKQINESEYKRLLAQLPDRKLPDNVFESRMKDFDRVLNEIERSRQSNMGGYGNKAKENQSIAPGFQELSGEDKQALDWANANPNDPRATEIKKKLGVK